MIEPGGPTVANLVTRDKVLNACRKSGIKLLPGERGPSTYSILQHFWKFLVTNLQQPMWISQDTRPNIAQYWPRRHIHSDC